MSAYKYEVNGEIIDNIFDINLLDFINGKLLECFKVFEDPIKDKEKISLEELINLQILEIEDNIKIGKYYDKFFTIPENSESIFIDKDDSFIGVDSTNNKIHINSNNSKLRVNELGTNNIISITGEFSNSIINGKYSKLSIIGDNSETIVESSVCNIHISGDNAKVFLNGVFCNLVITGDNADVIDKGGFNKIFLLGSECKVKASELNWITLCGFSKLSSMIAPTVGTANMNNVKYTDCNGNMLSRHETYIYYHGKFCPILEYNGHTVIKLRRKKLGDYEIIKCKVPDYELCEKQNIFIVSKDGFYSDNLTVKSAIKKFENDQIERLEIKKVLPDIMKEVKSSGVITYEQYCIFRKSCLLDVPPFNKNMENDDMRLDEFLLIINKPNSNYYSDGEFERLLNNSWNNIGRGYKLW